MRHNSNTRVNPSLLKILKQSLGDLNKSAVVAPQEMQPQDASLAGQMNGGMSPQDAAAMQGGGGGMPIDPATGMPIDPATGMPIDPATGMPIDPAMLQGAMPPGPAMAPDGLPMGGIPGPGGAPPQEDVKQQIKQVLEETGVIKAPKMKPEQQYMHIKQMLETLFQHLGLPVPPAPEGEAAEKGEGDGGGGGAAAMTSGMSGGASSQPSGSMPSQPITGSGGGEKAAQVRSNQSQALYKAIARLKR